MTPYYEDATAKIYLGDVHDVLRSFDSESVDCCVTSPPYYGLRDYGVEDQIGLEDSPSEYIAKLVEVFREVRRLLRNDGTLWLNLGDSYSGSWGNQGRKSTRGTQREINGEMIQPLDDGRYPNEETNTGKVPEGLKAKDLMGTPWRVAFALQADGWYLRSDIIWSKPNPMPESITDRPTKSHEYIFLMAKSQKYYYDAAAIAEKSINAGKTVHLKEKSLSRGQASGANVQASGNGLKESILVKDTKNKRTVWEVPTSPFPEAHFAVFPEGLIRPCVLAGCRPGGLVLDPFLGSGTTALVARNLNCRCVGVELNEKYVEIAKRRLSQSNLTFEENL